MTNQNKQTKMSRFGFTKLAVLALMLAAMLCCFSVMTSALEAPTLSLADHFTVGMTNTNNAYVKTYDGTADADIALNADGQAQIKQMMTALSDEELQLVDFGAVATFNSANVTDATTITVRFTATANQATTEAEAAAAKAKESLPADITVPGRIVPQTLTWNYASGSSLAVNDQYVWGKSEYTVTLNTAELPALSIANAPAFVDESVSVVIKNVQASDANGAGVLGTVEVALADANYVAEPLKVTLSLAPIEITEIVWNGSDAAGKYTFAYGDLAAHNLSAIGKDANGATYALSVVYPSLYGDAGVYAGIRATVPAGFVLANGVIDTTDVTITSLVYTVWMDGATYIGTTANQANPTVYSLAVSGDIPADIRSLITYTNNGQSKAGVYSVVATLPESASYSFVNQNGETVTALSATLQIRDAYVLAESEGSSYEVIVSAPNGFLGEISATLTTPENLPSKLVADFPAYKAYTVTINGSLNEKLTLTIPFSASLFVKDCKPLDETNLYIYDANAGTLVAANTIEGYTVTISDSYYQLEGVSSDSALTFVIAPTEDAPFWSSIWGILLIILFVIIALLVIMLLIGLLLNSKQNKKDDEATEEASEEVDTETEMEDEVDLEENLDEDDGDAVETVALLEDDDEDDEEDDEDDEDEDGEEGDSFSGFGSDQLDFIDASADADKYALLLAAVARGESRLVTRYRRSFQSRLCQSQGSVQDYYNEIKNLLLSYKGVKSRVSWNYEAFNCGRSHVAKINVKTKTIYLYLSLDPAALADTKYGVADMSAKKKYASVPVLLKIKGERKFKYALELIEKLCGEEMALKQTSVANTDYKMPYQSTEELVEAGYIKKMVAGVPIDD